MGCVPELWCENVRRGTGMQLIIGLFIGTLFGILIAAVLGADKGDK